MRGWLGRVHDSATRARRINSLPCVAIGLGLGLGDLGRDRGFFVATGLFGHKVVIMDSVATRYGQGREALCRDMETVSRQGTNPPLS